MSIDNEQQQLSGAQSGRGMSRRRFLSGLTGTSLLLVGGPTLLEACGSSGGSKGSSPTTGASGAAPAQQTSKILRMAQGSGPQTLDPDKTKAGTDAYIQQNMFETLLARDVNGNVVPRLATSYSVSPNGLQYTFHLRQGVTFHNGEPFDANAAKFSVERYVNPATENVFSFYLASLKSVVALDPATLQINLSSPIGNLIDNGGFVPIVPPQYITQHGDTYFANHPVGTGPFSFVSNVINESWSLKRFDGYWGPKPGYAGLDTTIITADASRLAALEAGQVDFITQVNPTDAASVQARGYTTKSTFSGTAFGLFFNMNAPGTPWQNQQVRQALNYAVDRNALRSALFLNYSTDYSKGLTQYEPGYNLLSYPDPAFDPNKAKQLLASAGYPHGFSMDIVGPANGRFANSTQVMEAVSGMWSNIGVKANVQALTYDQWLDALATKGHYNGIAFGDQSGLDPTTFYQQYFGTSSGYSHCCEVDPHMLSLLPALTTTNGNARAEACAAVARYNNDQFYMIPLYGDDVIYGMKGVQWTPWAGSGTAYMVNAYPT